MFRGKEHILRMSHKLFSCVFTKSVPKDMEVDGQGISHTHAETNSRVGVRNVLLLRLFVFLRMLSGEICLDFPPIPDT